MFERFTEQARAVIVDAQVQAKDLRHHYIGTEHLLLGLLAAPDRPAARALGVRGVDAHSARTCLLMIVPSGDEDVTGQIPFTPRAKKTLELSLRESLRAGTNHVAPEHVLLGLLQVDEGVSTQILRRLEVDVDALAEEVRAGLPPPDAGDPRTAASRRAAQARAGALPRAGVLPPLEPAFVVEPSGDVLRLLMSAGARALEAGRTQIEMADVQEALRRRGGSGDPPQASTG